VAEPDEELSELDSLYQASLLAPSMQRGSRGVSPQPTSNKPGSYCRKRRRYIYIIFYILWFKVSPVISMLLIDAELPSTKPHTDNSRGMISQDHCPLRHAAPEK